MRVGGVGLALDENPSDIGRQRTHLLQSKMGSQCLNPGLTRSNQSISLECLLVKPPTCSSCTCLHQRPTCTTTTAVRQPGAEVCFTRRKLHHRLQIPPPTLCKRTPKLYLALQTRDPMQVMLDSHSSTSFPCLLTTLRSTASANVE